LRYEYTGGAEQQKWDGTNDQGEAVASGVYLYRIENNREHVTGKLMIIR
jgi:flagellar hook assembly protein FlgD